MITSTYIHTHMLEHKRWKKDSLFQCLLCTTTTTKHKFCNEISDVAEDKSISMIPCNTVILRLLN